MRRVSTIVILSAIALSATTASCFAVDTTGFGFAGQPNALEERLFADAADGRLDEFSPLEAALVAGGVETVDVLRQYEQKAKSLADELRRSKTYAGTSRQQIEAVFDFMHRRILRGGYELAATDLRQTLDQGRFNCVSATVLFNYLAGQIGLNSRGLEMPSHAMSRVVLSDGTIDVETTCPGWFHLADKSKRQEASDETNPFSLRQRVGQSSATSADRSQAREVSPIQLTAMIYYNRGVDLLAEKRFAEAAAANAKSLRLDPTNATARGNLLATINNWSIDLGDSQHFAEAVDLLHRGLAIDPRFDAFAQNYVHVHQQWTEHLCQAGRFKEAIAILTRASAELSDRDYFRRAKTEVQERWARTIVAPPPVGPLLEMPCVKIPTRVD